MHTEPNPSHPASNPEIQYEKTDAAPRPLYQFLFWISVITLATAVLAGLIVMGLERWSAGTSTRPAMAEPQDKQQPPGPRLQLIEPKDLASFRKEEAAILSTYAVVDREKGVFRIPIEEAMRLTLERGLPAEAAPAQTTAPAATSAPTPAPGAHPAAPAPHAAGSPSPKAEHR
jgi:hypothetical protein